MTFAALKDQIKSYCGLTSAEADTRVGAAVNRHYRRITSQLGLDSTRFVTRLASATSGVRTVTFTEIEKIDRILDATESGSIRLLDEVSIHAQRSAQPSASTANTWALQNTDADSVTVLLDTVPQEAYDLQADGWTTLSDLTGTQEPIFPESFHDILVWFVIAEELLKKEKDKLAREYERRAEKLLSDLRFHLADSHTTDVRQGGSSLSGRTGGGGGGGTTGGTSYTQTGNITFDLDPAAPFAVSAGSAKVANLDADKLDGQTGADYHDASLLTGAISAAAIPNDSVTYARMQNVSAASRLIGRGSAAGSGDPQELTVGTGLTISGTVVSATSDEASYILASQVFS